MYRLKTYYIKVTIGFFSNRIMDGVCRIKDIRIDRSRFENSFAEGACEKFRLFE